MAKKWTYKTGKVRGAFAVTDYGSKVIKINKKLHKQAKKTKKGHWKKYGMSKKETTIINTLVHETLHKNHPKMHEKTVRKLAKRKVKKMGKKAKQKLYNKVK